MTNRVETERRGEGSSWGWGAVFLSTFLFVGGIGLGIWATQSFLLERNVVEKQFEPRARMSAAVQDSSPITAPILDPKQYVGPRGYSKLTDAVLLNGGGSAQSNYFSHHLHIRMLHELLRRRGLLKRHIQVLSSDGESRSLDQVVSSPLPKSWLWTGLPEAQMIDTTRSVNTTFRYGRMLPAKRSFLRRGFARMARRFKRKRKPSTLLLFVTDHGTKGRGPWGNKIELWKQQLRVDELRDMLEPMGRRTRVISVMSQCYSGGFANLLYRKNWSVHGNRCGFYSTVANREAYGCFPQTATKDRVGHAYRMIRAMRRARTIRDAHREIVLSDLTPDVPVSTSDIYLEDMLRRKFRRTRPWTRGVDRILRRIWRKPHKSLRADIRLLHGIERTFYLPKYKTLAKVWSDIRKVRRSLKEIKQLESMWKGAWTEVQRGSLMNYYQNNPRMAQSVEFELNRPELDNNTRRVGRMLHRSYLRYLDGEAGARVRLARMYKRFNAVQKKIHLLHTHEASLLRVAKRLTRIAGLDYLRRSGSRRHRRNFKNLMVCETTPIGGPKVKGVLRAEGIKRDIKKPRKLARISMKSLIPSRLGIGFDLAPRGWYPRFAKLAPGAVVVTQVSPNSPAAKSGIRRGDIIVAVGGKMLKVFGEIRELVLLSPPSKKNYFLIYRNRKMKTLRVRLERYGNARIASAPPRPVAPPPMQGDPPPGFQDDSDHDTRVYGLRRKHHRTRPQRRKAVPKGTPLTTVNGRPIPFPAKRGATVAFFWATWCEGCKAMAPMLKALQRRYQGRGLTLLTVTSDSPSLLRPFLRSWGARWPFRVAIDKTSSLSRRFRISSIPQLIIFKPDGSVALHIRRFHDGSRRQIESVIRRLLRR